MGVKTGAASFAFWQVDPSGISLWLDIRNGGNGVQLGDRKLQMATIVTHIGAWGESAFTATQRLCRAMTEGTKIPGKRGVTSLDAIYGSNDWYYAYGNNTHDGILRDADLIRSLAPATGDKPFTVIDDGYQDRSRFPSLQKLATEIRSRQVTLGSGSGLYGLGRKPAARSSYRLPVGMGPPASRPLWHTIRQFQRRSKPPRRLQRRHANGALT
jgi:alpha-galactosidase